MQSMNSPHLAKTFEVFQTATELCLISEYYAGGDLSKILEQSKTQKVNRDEVWWAGIFHQCLEGLRVLHRHCIIHCDIKETNIMVRDKDMRRPMLVLIDFGLASSFAVDRCWGTPLYQPPEVIAGERRWVPSGDVWSLGIVLIQLMGLGGGFLMDCDSLQALERRICRGHIPLEKLRAFPTAKDLAENMLRRPYNLRLCKKAEKPRFTVLRCLEHPWFLGMKRPEASSRTSSRRLRNEDVSAAEPPSRRRKTS